MERDEKVIVLNMHRFSSKITQIVIKDLGLRTLALKSLHDERARNMNSKKGNELCNKVRELSTSL